MNMSYLKLILFTGKAYTDGVYVGEFVAIETALEQ